MEKENLALSFYLNKNGLWNIRNVTPEQKDAIERLLMGRPTKTQSAVKRGDKVQNTAKRISKLNEELHPVYNPQKLETYFDYKIIQNNGIALKLKPEVSREELLNWEGFNMNYNYFKLEGDIVDFGNGRLLMADTETGESWSITWGISTSMVYDSVWKMQRQLIKCAYWAAPELPSLKNYPRKYGR